MNIFVETILQDKIKELFDSGKFILIGSFENMDNERFCLSEKLKDPYKSLYDRTIVMNGKFPVTENDLWYKMNIYYYEKDTEKYLLFEVIFKSEENCIKYSACCEYMGNFFKFRLNEMDKYK